MVSAGITKIDIGLEVKMGFMDSLKGITRAKTGVPSLSKEELLVKLLGLNSEELPFKVEKGSEADLLAQWKIVDATWYEIFAKANLEKVHKIWLSLDENEKTVRVLEESYSVAWRAGIPAFSLEMEKFQGRSIGSKSFGIGYAFKGPDPLSFGKVYQYRFDVSEMKRPIIEIVTGSGWDFVPVISKKNLIKT
jgi:hypothetical protein